jgi:hypothetical protein
LEVFKYATYLAFCFLAKIVIICIGERTLFSINAIEKIGYSYAERSQPPYLSPVMKIKTVWIKYLNVSLEQ